MDGREKSFHRLILLWSNQKYKIKTAPTLATKTLSLNVLKKIWMLDCKTMIPHWSATFTSKGLNPWKTEKTKQNKTTKKQKIEQGNIFPRAYSLGLIKISGQFCTIEKGSSQKAN